ncbi:MAG: 2-oxo acid dehydrogenase subunit E2, partial [Cytophagales bacterium]|nr:2-oxo acid dehydrogenase subunit E2 [Cytophagales bacterium]
MAEIIRMPKMSDTMTEGVIAAWHKKVGDAIKSGDLLAEIETDKATMDFESPETGTLLYVGPKEKEAVPIDGILAIVGKQGENVEALLKSGTGGATAPKPEAQATPPAPQPPKPAEPAPAAAAPAPKAPAANVKAQVVRMPKMSDTMAEGTVVAWHKKVGDPVKSGDLLAEIETDKATMDFESPEAGTLLYIGVNQGDAVAVDGVLAVIGEKGADFNALLGGEATQPAAGAPATQPAAPPKPETAGVPATGANGVGNHAPAPVEADDHGGDGDGRLKISPLARKLASDKGFDIRQIKGTGENGRIVRRDVETFVPQAKPTPVAVPAEPAPAAKPTEKAAPAPIVLPTVVGEERYEEVPVSQMRKVIARRLGESMFSAPHFYLTMEINMDKAVAAREGMNEFSPVKISFNDIVIKACALALRKHPKVNSSWLGDKIRYNQHVHIGVAVAVEEGLLVPVVRFADSKTLSHLAAEIKELGGKAKTKKLQPKEMEGNTFTVSNLGMFGIEDFTAIINPPDACILAVGGIKQVPVVKDGEIKIGNVMKVTLSCDHRVVDGAT